MKTLSTSRWMTRILIFILLTAALGGTGPAQAGEGASDGQPGGAEPAPVQNQVRGDGISGGGYNITPPVIPVQGKLTDSFGSVVTGDRTLILSLYDAETALVALCSEFVPVTVVNGLFNALLQTCTAQHIFGERLWLGIQVKGEASEMTPRQPVYAVPYAISLVPGASVTQSSSSDYTLNLANTAGADVLQIHSGYGNFINAQSTLDDPRFVVKNGGEIWSKAESKIAVSPLNGVTEISGRPVLTPKYYNALWVRGNVTGNSTVFIPVDAPLTLYGSPLKLTGARVCYITELAANYISRTAVRMIYEGGAYDDIATDTVPRNATGSNMICYDLTLGANTNVTGALMFHFTLYFANTTDQIHLGSLTLTLANQ